MWYELFIITASGLGVSIFLIWLLASRIPTQETLFQVGNALIDAKLKEFNLTSSGPGGRKTEGLWGFVEGFLQTPTGQELIKKFAGGMVGGTGGFNIGP